MTCDPLPTCAAGEWTLWMRKRPDCWRFSVSGPLWYVRECDLIDGDVEAAVWESVILPPGERPILERP